LISNGTVLTVVFSGDYVLVYVAAVRRLRPLPLSLSSDNKVFIDRNILC